MRQSETLGALAKALCAAQADLKPAVMGSTNPFLKSKYADLGAVIEAARPVMKANGLSVSQMVGGEPGTIAVETILMHESGEWLASSVSLPLADERGKSTAQVAGSIVTYLRRYALAAALGIHADEDTDGHAPAPAAPRKPAAARPAHEATPEPASPPAATETQRKRMHALLGELGITERDARLALASWSAKRTLTSTSELTGPETARFIDYLAHRATEAKEGPRE